MYLHTGETEGVSAHTCVTAEPWASLQHTYEIISSARKNTCQHTLEEENNFLNLTLDMWYHTPLMGGFFRD